jgi:sulfur carrier protein
MIIQVNGASKELVEASISVLDLLKVCKVEIPDMVSVQLNGTFVEKADYVSTIVNNNDEVDFLYFMGGGGLW